jgi:hypothetical protein
MGDAKMPRGNDVISSRCNGTIRLAGNNSDNPHMVSQILPVNP